MCVNVCHCNDRKLYISLNKTVQKLFGQTRPQYNIRVAYGAKSKMDYCNNLQEAERLYKHICAYWHFVSLQEDLQNDLDKKGYSHEFYKDSNGFDIDSMHLLSKSDFQFGLKPTITSFDFNDHTNSFVCYLLYCNNSNGNEIGHFFRQFESVGLKFQYSERNIAWRLTPHKVTLCKYLYEEDFEDIHNSKIRITTEYYNHPNVSKFIYLSISNILVMLHKGVLCTNPLFW